MILRKLQGPLRVALAGILIATIAVVDWRVDPPISFGFLYLFPILLIGTVARWWQVVAVALLCTALADIFAPDPWHRSVPQDVLIFTALAGTGLFAYELTRSRLREQENTRRLEREVAARREAEEQLEFVIDSSPVAILTMTADCLIRRANSAAHRLLR
jgi:PAS domain-containing protein